MSNSGGNEVRKSLMYNLRTGLAFTDEGEVIPIASAVTADDVVHHLDRGDPMPLNPVTLVVGPCNQGKWYTLDCRKFERRTIH